MSLENRKKSGIGKKIDSYEFDFNPKAWDKMETMLDNENPSEARRKKPVFFTIKILAAMVFLIVLAFLLMPVAELSDTGSFQQISKKSEISNRNSSVADRTFIEGENATTADLSFIQKQKSTITEASKASTSKAKQAVSFKLPALAFLPGMSQTPYLIIDKQLPYLPTPLLQKNDSSFLPNLEERMADYNDHFSPEKVYLQFDKPFFKPGETIWFNAFVRDANTLGTSEKSDFLHVELLKPNGGVLQKIKIKAQNGTAAGRLPNSEGS